MHALLKGLGGLLLVVAIALAVWFYRRRRAEQMRYAILSMYEDADKQFQSIDRYSSSDGLLESDRLVQDQPLATYSIDLEDVSSSSPPSIPAEVPPTRATKEKKRREKTQQLLGVDTDDVNAVQALIRQELESL